jgi:hypothetical protein
LILPAHIALSQSRWMYDPKLWPAIFHLCIRDTLTTTRLTHLWSLISITLLKTIKEMI